MYAAEKHAVPGGFTDDIRRHGIVTLRVHREQNAFRRTSMYSRLCLTTIHLQCGALQLVKFAKMQAGGRFDRENRLVRANAAGVASEASPVPLSHNCGFPAVGSAGSLHFCAYAYNEEPLSIYQHGTTLHRGLCCENNGLIQTL